MKKATLMKKIESIINNRLGDKHSYNGHALESIIQDAVNTFDKSLMFTNVNNEPVADWISVWWHVDDIKDWTEEFNHKYSHEILHNVKRNHDCNVGINWEVIEWEVHNSTLKKLA